MDPSLLEIMEALIESIERRDAGEPDTPAREAEQRIRRLETELVDRLADLREQLPERLAGAGPEVPIPHRLGVEIAGPAG